MVVFCNLISLKDFWKISIDRNKAIIFDVTNQSG